MKKPGTLTPKQKRFVLEYLVDLNATAASIRAGYSERSAKRIGWELLQKPEVSSGIQEAMVARSKDTGVTAEWVLRTLAEEKTADLADLYDDDGNILPVKKWPMVFRRGLVVGVESVEEFTGIIVGGRRQFATLRKVKLSDRIKHMELIGRHVDVQAFKDRHEHGGPNGGPIPVANIAMTSDEFRAIAAEVAAKT